MSPSVIVVTRRRSHSELNPSDSSKAQARFARTSPPRPRAADEHRQRPSRTVAPATPRSSSQLHPERAARTLALHARPESRPDARSATRGVVSKKLFERVEPVDRGVRCLLRNRRRRGEGGRGLAALTRRLAGARSGRLQLGDRVGLLFVRIAGGRLRLAGPAGESKGGAGRTWRTGVWEVVRASKA